MKTRKEKAQEIEALHEKFSRAKGVIFTNYKGLTVAEMMQMRRILKEAEIEYRVVKNTLAKIAAQDTPVEVARDEFVGPVGLAIGYDDPVLVAKKILEYQKEKEDFEIRCGVIEGRLMDLDGIKAVSKLPSREVQLAMLAGAMKAPAQKMASALQATIRKLAYALNALKEKKEQ
ncbi:MAG: 50S ribosomal protein L10 [Nitrospirae bacterium]|nr:50S ribosomal protein L10 [Nitrospirota bacterium]